MPTAYIPVLVSARKQPVTPGYKAVYEKFPRSYETEGPRFANGLNEAELFASKLMPAQTRGEAMLFAQLNSLFPCNRSRHCDAVGKRSDETASPAFWIRFVAADGS